MNIFEAGSFLMVVVISVMVAWSGCRPVSPTPLPGAEYPEWQGLVVGQSDAAELALVLGQPIEVFVHGYVRGVDMWCYLDSSSQAGFYVGVSQANGVIKYILPVVHSTAYPLTETYPPTLEQFIEEYGEPGHVTWGSGQCTRTYIWADKGIAIEAGVPAWSAEWGTRVVWVEYFVPTDTDTYLRTWGDDIYPRRGYGEEDAYHNPEIRSP
jgi:hypothetical protein